MSGNAVATTRARDCGQRTRAKSKETPYGKAAVIGWAPLPILSVTGRSSLRICHAVSRSFGFARGVRRHLEPLTFFID
jgi:hypothetical protein